MLAYETLLKEKYPAKAHCRTVARKLKADLGEAAPTILYLQGQEKKLQEDSDQEVPFRFPPTHLTRV